MAARRNAAVELFWKLHPHLYRWSGGRIGGRLMGLPVLLLTTTGRRSGEPRTTALTDLAHGDAFVVIASVLGEPRHPAWWRNLEAQPEAEVHVGRERHRGRARNAQGAEGAEAPLRGRCPTTPSTSRAPSGAFRSSCSSGASLAGTTIRHGAASSPGPRMPEGGLLALPPDAWGAYWGSRHHMLTGLAAWFHVVWVDPPRHWRAAIRSAPSSSARPGGPPPALPGFVRHVSPRWLPHFHRPAGLSRRGDRVRWLCPRARPLAR